MLNDVLLNKIEIRAHQYFSSNHMFNVSVISFADLQTFVDWWSVVCNMLLRSQSNGSHSHRFSKINMSAFLTWYLEGCIFWKQMVLSLIELSYNAQEVYDRRFLAVIQMFSLLAISACQANAHFFLFNILLMVWSTCKQTYKIYMQIYIQVWFVIDSWRT